MRTVGQNVVEIRERLELSQVELADRLGVRQPSIWKIENSKAIPNGATLLKLAKALDVSIDDLVAGVDEDYQRSRVTSSDTASRTTLSARKDGADASAAVRKSLARERKRLARICDLLVEALEDARRGLAELTDEEDQQRRKRG